MPTSLFNSPTFSGCLNLRLVWINLCGHRRSMFKHCKSSSSSWYMWYRWRSWQWWALCALCVVWKDKFANRSVYSCDVPNSFRHIVRVVALIMLHTKGRWVNNDAAVLLNSGSREWATIFSSPYRFSFYLTPTRLSALYCFSFFPRAADLSIIRVVSTMKYRYRPPCLDISRLLVIVTGRGVRRIQRIVFSIVVVSIS